MDKKGVIRWFLMFCLLMSTGFAIQYYFIDTKPPKKNIEITPLNDFLNSDFNNIEELLSFFKIDIPIKVPDVFRKTLNDGIQVSSIKKYYSTFECDLTIYEYNQKLLVAQVDILNDKKSLKYIFHKPINMTISEENWKNSIIEKTKFCPTVFPISVSNPEVNIDYFTLMNTETPFGYLCGIAPSWTSGVEAINKLINNNETELLSLLLKIAPPSGKLYALEGLLSLKTNYQFTDLDKPHIDFLKDLNKEIMTCNGCIYSSKVVKDIFQEHFSQRVDKINYVTAPPFGRVFEHKEPGLKNPKYNLQNLNLNIGESGSSEFKSITVEVIFRHDNKISDIKFLRIHENEKKYIPGIKKSLKKLEFKPGTYKKTKVDVKKILLIKF